MFFLALMACNQPPGEAGVAISPTAPTTLDDLVVEVTDAVDPNRNDTVNHSIVWLRDGIEVEDLADATIVPAGLTAKNEEWTVQVTPADDKEAGPTASHTVTVVNSLPEATATCAQSRSDQDVVVTAGATDADNDGVSFRYAWTRNGGDTPFTTDTIPAGEVSRGDLWAVTVTPHDGQEEGPPVTADVTVGNALPVITDAFWNDGADPAREGTTLSIGVTTDDPDGDTVLVRVVWFVDDVEVTGLPDGQTTLTGEHFDKGDSVRAVLIPGDGFEDGEAWQLDARIIQNTPPDQPVVVIDTDHDDQDHVCLVTGGDLDGDILTYAITWSVNGADRTSLATTTSLPGDTLPAEATIADDEVVCEAVADDGQHTSLASTDTIVVVPVLVLDGGTETLTDGSYTYGRIELTNSARLDISGVVELYADSFSIDGDSYIWGVAGGEPEGTGDGAGSEGSGGGGGGAGYGGNGGGGGYDSSDSQGAGGSAYGSQDGFEIYAGSGGAHSASSGGSGGAGGAGLLVEAEAIDISGLINVSGDNGGGGQARNGGGGSGGGILLYGDTVTVAGALVSGGGDGGSGTSSANDGGGGGAGGRIKVFYGTTYTLTGTTDVAGGEGGLYGGSSYGEDGEAGTVHDEQLNWN